MSFTCGLMWNLAHGIHMWNNVESGTCYSHVLRPASRQPGERTWTAELWPVTARKEDPVKLGISYRL